MLKTLIVLIFVMSIFAENSKEKLISQYDNSTPYKAQNNLKMVLNPEEEGNYMEGDILTKTAAKNGIKSESLRWKNGEIPFEIRGNFSKSVSRGIVPYNNM